MNDVDVAREHAEVADWDAAFVLGALTPADRRRYERHVEDCARCRTAVGEVSGLPGLLAGVPLAQIAGATAGDDAGPDLAGGPPADLLPRLSAAVTRRRRHRVRRAVAGGLVAAAVVALAVVVFRPFGDTAPAPSRAAVTLPLRAVTPNPLAVDVSLVSEPWGTRVDLDCRFAGDGGNAGPDRDYDYALYLTNRAGVTMAGPTWTYGPDTSAEPVGTSKWPVDQIATVEVRGGDGTVLLRATR